MYQSVSQRFPRSKNNDLFVTFLPVIIVFTLHSYLRSAGLDEILFRVLQALAIALLVVLLLALNLFYFRAFRYTIVGSGQERPKELRMFPENSLTFERLQNKKSRVYECVKKKEMLCLLKAGEDYDETRFGPVTRTFNMTVCSAKTAVRLYYKQNGAVYCAKFHPDAEQTDLLRRWIDENNQS